MLAKDFDIKIHDDFLDEHKDFQPSVDVFLPNCGEDLRILGNTFKAVARLDYANINVWVLDDRGRDEVKILAEMHGFTYIARKNQGYLKKAGNMRNAFAQTSSDLIFVLDADFAPRPDFLKETVPYFSDKEVGIVQTPQYFQVSDTDTTIQKGATFLQEVFHRLIQSFRNQWGSSVCTGSCAVYRRAALQPYGGAYPVERSEDVNTGLAVLRAGWKLKFIPLVLSAGLSPDTIQAFCNQNYRWCSGSLHLITTSLFWTQPNISIFGKLSYCLSILYYLSSGLGTVMFSLPSIINVWFFPESFAIANYSLIAPALFICVGLRSIWSSQQWGYGVILASFTSGYTNLTSIIDVLRGNIAEWIPTGDLQANNKKTSVFSKVQKFALILPIINVSLFMSGLWLHWQNILVSPVQVLPTVMWFSSQLWLSFFFFMEINKDMDGQEIVPCLAAPKI